jgi:ribosome-binding protein aMBF1 (putative translation factor)
MTCPRVPEDLRPVKQSEVALPDRCALNLPHNITRKKAPARCQPSDARRQIDVTDQSQGASCAADPPPRNVNIRPPRRRGRPPTPADVLGAAGAALRARREGLGLPLSHIATRVNVSIVHLSEVERGRKGASASVLEEVAVVLGLDVAEVLCSFRVVPDRIAASFFNAERMRAALGAQ